MSDTDNEYGGGGGLQAFLDAQTGHTDDGDHEAPDSPEGDQAQTPGEDQAGGSEARSGEPEGTGQDQSRSRMLRNIARLERQAAADRARIKELEAASQRPAQGQEPDDPIELLRVREARRLGVKPDDPRVTQRLLDISQDITIAQYGDKVDADPALAERRQQLAEERRRRDERDAQSRRIEQLEARDRERQERAEHREATLGVQQMLTKTPHPFLVADHGDDPQAAATQVVDLALRAIKEGKVDPPQSPEEGGRLLSRIAGNLERAARTRAQRLAGLLGNGNSDAAGAGTAGNRIGTGMTTDRADAASAKRTGATERRARQPAATGGGGRGRPASPPSSDDMADDGPEDLNTFVNRRARELRNAGRGNR